MTTLLKRLSLSLDRKVESPTQPVLISHPSFNDFSCLAAQDIDREVETHHVAGPGAVRNSMDVRPSMEEQRQMRPSPFIVGSAPAGLPPILPKSAALKIPRPSAAHSMAAVAAAAATAPDSTPRSVVATPRRSDDMPASPRSPTSPRSGRRHPRSPKIDGMDYYEFCELLRSSSL